MKLDPVLLLAPDPEPPAPSRRAFAWSVVGALCAGGIVGFAAARGLSSRRPAPDPAAPGDREPDAAGLSALDRWAIDLAARGSEDDLAAEFESYLLVFHTRAPLQPQLRPGVERLVAIVLAADVQVAPARRQALAAALLQALAELPPSDPLHRARPSLERQTR